MSAVATNLDEEAFVKSVAAGLRMPPGVEFQRVEQSIDWQGNPALRIYLTSSVSKPLTKKRIRALNEVANAIEDAVINSPIEKFPYTEIVEVE